MVLFLFWMQGLNTPENEQLGVDVVIPNMDYLFENRDRIAGSF